MKNTIGILTYLLPLTILSAADLTFQQGVSGYAFTFDTFLRQASPDTISGGLAEVQVDSDQAGMMAPGPAHGLLRFENLFGVALGQVPSGAVINSASLKLVSNNNSVGSFTIHRMTVSWDEDSTWNSLGDGITLGSDVVTLPTQTFTPSGIFSLDVTSDVVAWASGQDNFGWGFITSSTDGWDFDSSEAVSSSQRPELTINFTVVPEPSSLAMAIAGAACLFPLLRRQARSKMQG